MEGLSPVTADEGTALAIGLLFAAIVLTTFVNWQVLDAWVHRVRRHRQTDTRVTIGMMDTSRGILRTCSCGKVWAL